MCVCVFSLPVGCLGSSICFLGCLPSASQFNQLNLKESYPQEKASCGLKLPYRPTWLRKMTKRHDWHSLAAPGGVLAWGLPLEFFTRWRISCDPYTCQLLLGTHFRCISSFNFSNNFPRKLVLFSFYR